MFFVRERASPMARRAERTPVREHARYRDREAIGRKTPGSLQAEALGALAESLDVGVLHGNRLGKTNRDPPQPRPGVASRHLLDAHDAALSGARRAAVVDAEEMHDDVIAEDDFRGPHQEESARLAQIVHQRRPLLAVGPLEGRHGARDVAITAAPVGGRRRRARVRVRHERECSSPRKIPRPRERPRRWKRGAFGCDIRTVGSIGGHCRR
jgi:hypothetical protein